MSGASGRFAERWAAAGAVFDRSVWPIPEPHFARYQAACLRGRERMARSRTVLCGLVRDGARDLPRIAPQIDRIAGGFADHRIFFYENDSHDATVTELEAWARRDPRVSFASERLGRPRHPSERTEARRIDMAHYRNRCREAVVERFGDFDHVIVLDTDLVGYDADGVAHSFGQDGWDALAAKGVSWLEGEFRCPDAWAFRALGKPEFNDPHEVNGFVPERGAPLVPVLSCFGGLAVYRMEAFARGRYAGDDCEHVTFHASLREAGFGRIFMNPSLLTLYPDFLEIFPGAARRALEERERARAPAARGRHATS